MTMTLTLSASDLPSLPQEIVVEILSKLPAKSLVRFKCVSKFFSSLVVDHPFADLHRNWSLTLPSRMSILIFFPDLIYPNTTSNYTINYDSEENQGKLQANRLQYIDDDPNLFRKLYISSSVYGLICFSTYSLLGDDTIAIHNLSTRHHISLPSNCPRDSRTWMNAFGLLGFDSVSRRYKVLKSVKFTDRNNIDNVSVKHWIFTLGVDKSWREIHSSPSYHPYNGFNAHFYFHKSVHINGVIYSLNSLNKGHLVAFDVRVENFQVLPPLPPSITMMPGLMPGLVEVDGRLAIVDHLISDDELSLGIKIWTLEESSMVWKKQYLIRIPIPESESFNKRRMLFATNHFGEFAMLLKSKRSISILFYNFRRQSWRKFDICDMSLGEDSPLPLGTSLHFIVDHVF